MKGRPNKLAVVGGGAAGLAAAIAAGERARELDCEFGRELEIVVYERDDRVGRSILATGNGRCNFSNANLDTDCYRNVQFVDEVFRNLFVAYTQGESDRFFSMVRDNGDAVHAFFYQHGLMWREEGDGRQYPRTNKASTVVDILRASVQQVGVREACDCEVRVIEPPYESGKQFTLRMADRSLERADAVIVTCGGKALGALALEGFAVVPQRPMLGPLRVADSYLRAVRELDNIRVRCTVSLVRPCGKGSDSGNPIGEGKGPDGSELIAEEKGELLFRKYGVSGICVFNLSRFAQAGDLLRINLLDGATFDRAKDYLFSRRKLLSAQFDGLTCSDMVRGLLLPRVADVVLGQAGLVPAHAFSKADVPVLARALTAFTLEVAGIGDVDVCQVRRGGLDVAGFDPSTMEAHGVAGLFAAGEALDVDGPCGGYNLHWAWASGLLAGRSAASALAGSAAMTGQDAEGEGDDR